MSRDLGYIKFPDSGKHLYADVHHFVRIDRQLPPPPASSLLKLELKTQFAWKCFICKMVPEKETVVEGAKRRKRTVEGFVTELITGQVTVLHPQRAPEEP